MSEVNGQLCTCERCGFQIFRKAIGEGEADGGYTRWNKFEDYPDGWGLVGVPEDNGARYGYIRVCPSCHDLWDKLINENFLKGTEYYKENDDG